MSSNAFARSRPRVRHQRVPRTHCYVHPRFLQLVRELARIDEAKKKQDEVECDSGGGANVRDEANQAHLECLTTTNNPPVISSDCNSSIVGPRRPSCCGAVDEAQTSNGYRSLECNQSTSALHDNYYRHDNHHYNQNHNHPESYHLSSAPLHFPLDDRCTSKCSPATAPSSTAATNFGFSKQGLVEQSNSDFSNNITDLRQDENRSKRKRSSNDQAPISKKVHPSSSTCGSSKRHKASPEPIRPLSPSFTKCPICLLDCMDRDPSFTNTCFHLFCYVCIENWTKNKATCPLCRTKFTKIIYNIRSASCFDEKIASPIRRDEDDDRVIYEQLQGLNTNLPIRHPNAEDTRLLFDNLRNNDVLMPPFAFVNQMDPRQVPSSLHSFNSVATNTNFNTSVPHTPFTNYNPIASNYIALIPSNNRIQPTTSTAITSAYNTNTGLTSTLSDPSNRTRVSRSGRFIYHSRYADLPNNDGSRTSRTTSTTLNQPGIALERQHHQQHQQQSHHQHHNHHNQHRSTTLSISAVELAYRQNQRIDHPHLHMAYPIQPRHYNPNVYSRRPYTNPPMDQHILDNLHRQMPDL